MKQGETMYKEGILISAVRKESRYGGHYYLLKIRCTDCDRTLMADPRMANWQNWEELVQTIQKDLMKNRGIVLGNLKVLLRKGELKELQLDADVRPEIIDIVKITDKELA
jgi:hypothetical protein